MRSLLLGAALAVGVGALAPRAMVSVAQARVLVSLGDEFKKGDKVTIKLKDGRTVEGVVVEANEQSVRIRQKTGTISSEQSYARSEIESISISSGDSPEAKPASNKKDSSDTPKSPSSSAKPDENDPDAKTVYLVPISGEFGRDVSATPLRDVMADARKYQPDYLIFRIDSEFAFGRKAANELDLSQLEVSWGAGLETASEMATIITDRIRDDKEWKKKPQTVMWVHRAMGPVAFFTLVCPNIYFAPNGKLGGIGYLDLLFKGVGDVTVQEKQRSLRLGRANGLMEKGGYDSRLMRAMARMEFVLSVNYVGGKPEYHEDMTGSEILTDDGNEETGHRDSLEDAIRGRGNDVLTLDAEKAQRLLVSKGTASNRDELMERMGIERHAKDIKQSKAGQIFREWSKSVNEAESEIQRLIREVQRTPIAGDTPELRNQGRGKRIGLLNKVKDIYTRYKEALDPTKFGSAEEQALVVQVNTAIDELKQQIRLDVRR